MKILRSWPATIPDGRSYVVDELPRLYMKDHDYSVLDQIDDDVILLEWDTAVGRDELALFAKHARSDPTRIIVAPYLLYASASGKDVPTTWAHRIYLAAETSMRFVTPGDPYCHLFGLGLSYLPREMVRRFLHDWPGRFGDVEFSAWHYRTSEHPNVPVIWDVRPVHVHYDIAALAATVQKG